MRGQLKLINAAVRHQPVRHLELFVEKMREAAPFGPIPWADWMWDLTGKLTRAGKRLHVATRDRLWFIEYRASRSDSAVPFNPAFDDFAKAIICARHLRGAQVAGAHAVSIRALRYIHAALAEDGTPNPCRLERRHLYLAESAARGKEKPSSAYRVGQRIEEIASLVDQHGIAHVRLEHRSTIPKNAAGALDEKMPSAEILKALGDISSSAKVRISKRYWIPMRIVDILVAAGFRIGEGVTLPVDPIVVQGDGIGLRYWPEKGGKIRVKQISTVHRELVERAVSELDEACAEAREVARRCEEHPEREVLPKDLPAILSCQDIEALGLAADGAAWLRTHKVPVFIENRRAMCRRVDVEKALRFLRGERPPLKTGDGREQQLSESLIVLFRNELHRDRATNRFVPTWIRWGQIADFLGARDDGESGDESSSVFSHFNVLDSTGAPFKITSHQFRHWLSTIAKRGGLTDAEMARWMGRKRMADNSAYDHRTRQERAEEARDLIRKGQAAGPVADTYESLPPVEAEEFLQVQVATALSTPYGTCLHDYGQGPCVRHFSCAGCSELMRKKGDVAERKALSTMLKRTETNLEMAGAEHADGTYGASNWVAYNKRLVVDLTTLLAVDGDPLHKDGELVRVWPENRSKRRSFDE
jgi:integrase